MTRSLDVRETCDGFLPREGLRIGPTYPCATYITASDERTLDDKLTELGWLVDEDRALCPGCVRRESLDEKEK